MFTEFTESVQLMARVQIT